MRVKAVFNDRQPEYKYMPLGNGMADVFINKFIEEVINEEDDSSSFIYEQNEFRININELPEEVIKANPMDYLDYSTEIEDIPLEERINAIEDAIIELAEVIVGD